jgi:hypothetical protein
MVGVNKKSTFWLWIVVKDGPASTPICHLLVWAFVEQVIKLNKMSNPIEVLRLYFMA